MAEYVRCARKLPTCVPYARPSQVSCEPKVTQLQDARLGHQQVLGLDVPVDDVVVVAKLKGTRTGEGGVGSDTQECVIVRRPVNT